MLQCIKYICVVLAPLDYLVVFGADFLCVLEAPPSWSTKPTALVQDDCCPYIQHI